MNKLMLCGGILGFISVVMGAAADHAIYIAPEKHDSLETGIRYNMLYAVLIVALSIAPQEQKLRQAGFFFALGTICFSFGIYGSIATGFDQFTYVVPIGGILLMIGLIMLTLAALKSSYIALKD